jgi:hypothetical protein
LKDGFASRHDSAERFEVTAAETKASSIVEPYAIERHFEKACLLHALTAEWLNDLDNPSDMTPERRDSRGNTHPLANCQSLHKYILASLIRR